MDLLATLLLTPAKWLWGGLVKAGAWLLEKPIRAVLLLLVLHVAAHQFVIDPRLRADRDDWKAASAEWQDAAGKWQLAHETLRFNVARERAWAAMQDRQNAARVEREQAAIIEETRDAYEVRLADTRAAADRLRHQLAAIGPAAAGSDGSAPAVPGDYTARCQAFGAADCDALLAALPSLLTEAEANTNKLIGLQDWARGVLGIDFSGEGEAP